MKKSKKPSVRINRAIKSLNDANPRAQIGNVLFEQIINIGIQETKAQLKAMDRTRNHIIPPSMWEHCIEILEEHLQLEQ